KGIDPLGSTYKFIDYFTAFGTGWANGLSFTLAILLALFEFAIGVALLLNYRVNLFSWFALIFMAFFQVLTLYIALEDPVSDCGCFGDAIILTNWETFYKNIVLLLFAVLVFIYRKKYQNRFNLNFQNGYFVVILLVFGFLQFHSYNHLPLIDFRPYKIGANIIDGMAMPDDAPADVYRSDFVYRNLKTGRTKKFNEKNYPWQDTLNWEFVEIQSVLVKAGYHPPIHDFTIENRYGENVAEYYLYDQNYTLMLVSYNLEKASKKRQDKINMLAQTAIDRGWNFICLTSSTGTDIEKFNEEYQPPYEFFFCDEITLKTIIRSNPGLLLLQEGTILSKWHWRDLPEFEEVLE
ncbi:MAG: DoxX family protein, partial [Prolixibacteraceae bacterium]|nr:DoxX family protein [Prolixibacteraceae bacterium]